MENLDNLTLLLITPFIGALLILFIRATWVSHELISLLTGIALIFQIVILVPDILSGYVPFTTLATPIPGVPIALNLEPLGLIFALVSSILWVTTTIYSMGYMAKHPGQNIKRFYVCFCIAIGSALGVALSENLLTLFLFYELLTISTYPLVTYNVSDESKKAGRTYLGILIGTSMAFFLIAIIWTWNITGTTSFVRGGILENKTSGLIAGLLYTLFAFGIGKAALMPFHHWLPAAMVAPTPVSALLHAVAVVKTGVFAILKITIYIFGTEFLSQSNITAPVLWVGAITIVLASLIALSQNNLKRRLAYSTISQLSYVIVGSAMASATSIVGATLHIVTHATGKITLFFCAGAILIAANKKNIDELNGIGRRMPITMSAFFLASISIAGLPPMSGFWGKWYITLGAIDSGHGLIIGVLILSTLLNIAYLLPISFRAFFLDGSPEISQVTEAPKSCLIAITITTVICVSLFFYPNLIYRLASLLI